MSSSKAQAYIESRLAQHSGEEAELWARIEQLYKRKLWHQLTTELGNMVHMPMYEQGGLVELYEQFISDFADRLNQSSLVRICLQVATQIATPQDAIHYLEQVKERVVKHKSNDKLAAACAATAIAELKLRLGDVAAAKAGLTEVEETLEAVDGVTAMHADFYRVSAELFKNEANFSDFYTNALRFLGCTDVASLPVVEQVQRAFDLGLAAILGKGIYNFGELLAHPVLEALRGTDKEWLIELLFAFNSGDIAKFESLKGTWKAQQDLQANAQEMREKINLLALMELVFNAPAHQRSLSFALIASTARIPSTEVEMLVMKALSHGLVRGSIDQVDEVAKLDWVQPRVLDLKQVASMRDRIAEWSTKVDETAKMMEAKTPELFVQQAF